MKRDEISSGIFVILHELGIDTDELAQDSPMPYGVRLRAGRRALQQAIDESFGFRPTLEQLRAAKTIAELIDLVDHRLNPRPATEPPLGSRVRKGVLIAIGVGATLICLTELQLELLWQDPAYVGGENGYIFFFFVGVFALGMAWLGLTKPGPNHRLVGLIALAIAIDVLLIRLALVDWARHHPAGSVLPASPKSSSLRSAFVAEKLHLPAILLAVSIGVAMLFYLLLPALHKRDQSKRRKLGDVVLALVASVVVPLIVASFAKGLASSLSLGSLSVRPDSVVLQSRFAGVNLGSHVWRRTDVGSLFFTQERFSVGGGRPSSGDPFSRTTLYVRRADGSSDPLVSTEVRLSYCQAYGCAPGDEAEAIDPMVVALGQGIAKALDRPLERHR